MNKKTEKYINYILIITVIVSSCTLIIRKNNQYNLFVISISMLLSLFLSNLIHELAHQIVAIILNMKSNVVYVYPVNLIKKLEGWNIYLGFKIKFNSLGFIIPNLSLINEELQYKNLMKKMCAIAIIGPIASFTLGLICFFIKANILEFIIFKKVLIITSLSIGFLTLFGDGKMAILLLKDNIYRIKTILEFNSYSLNYFENKYIYDKANKYCEYINWVSISEKDVLQIELQSNLLYYSTAIDKKNLNEIVKENIKNIYINRNKIEKITPQMTQYIYNIIFYLIVVENNSNDSCELFLFYKDKMKKEEYLRQRSQYLIDPHRKRLESVLKELKMDLRYFISESYTDIEQNILIKHYNKIKILL